MMSSIFLLSRNIRNNGCSTAFSLSRSSLRQTYSRHSQALSVLSNNRVSRPSLSVAIPQTSSFTCLHSTTSNSSEIASLEEQIAAKGNQIRALKEDGISKPELAPHVEELLDLKAKLAELVPPPPKEETTETKSKKQQNQQQKKKQPSPTDESTMTASELRAARLAKVQLMRESNAEPYAYTYDPNRTASQLQKEYEGKLEPGEEDEHPEGGEIAVAGRIMARRVFGKLAFYTLQDETGVIQLQFDKKRLGERDADSFKVSFRFSLMLFTLTLL